MTITYPRELPEPWASWSPVTVTYELLLAGESSRTSRGETTFLEQVGSLWTASFTTRPMIESERRKWTAWKDSLRGNMLFYGHDPRRIYPQAYGKSVLSLSGGTFTGACQVTAAGGTTISLGSLPAGLIITAGDYISFAWLGSRWKVKALETVTANGSGVITGLEVAPWVRAGGTAPASATIVRPYCLMKIAPGTWSAQSTGRLSPISFDAIQDLGVTS